MSEDANILVVDDDMRICRILLRYLSSAGYTVASAANGDEMRECMQSFAADLVLLDLNMPGEHGLDICRNLRHTSDVGIIILTGSSDKVDEIVGLEGGADDYLVKPVEERELLARVRSVLRRILTKPANDSSEKKSVLLFSDWILDLASHELRSTAGEDVRLTSYEFQILAALVSNANKILSRDQIMNHVKGRDWIASDRSVDVLIGKIRKKIEKDPKNPALVKTMRGIGYKFTARVTYGA